MESTRPETPWQRYLRLMEERPEAFIQSPLLPIVTDPEEAAAFTRRTGRAIGVVYESPYRLLVVDLVRGPEGPFAFERILPKAQGAAVVLLPRWKGKFVLLEQYRHALRGCQTAFPRGFGEDGLTPAENACKELWEELRAQVIAQRPLGRIAIDSGLTGNHTEAILCEITEPDPPVQYEEIQGMVCLTPAELEARIAAGAIDDGFTLAAFALFRADAAGNGACRPPEFPADSRE